MNRYHVSIAAEAYAAATLARCQYEVSVQYGANQPGYDLIAIQGPRTLKVSVKGSQDGGWALLAKYKRGKTWHQAIDAWLAAQPANVVMYFVQFRGVPVDSLPRMYVARAQEVAQHLTAGRAGHGSTCLGEFHRPKRGVAKGTTHDIPSVWAATPDRIATV